MKDKINKLLAEIITEDISAEARTMLIELGLMIDQNDDINFLSAEKKLGCTDRKFIIWHDGGEWLISLEGKEMDQCKTLREWLTNL